ncbi:kinase-like domain-containing protein [Ilyonectria robusta]|uniref:kinase-like domain-containing protein n=1 Tax=Ilyonectria robusta TaxID=1079257 RepID=UPI001E8D0B23|nr:kinase-like domain-containing protein [Ilyonectria robusta]KAH8653026.1 kinase-like domain-containing protein [Ilyonectria robusta]
MTFSDELSDCEVKGPLGQPTFLPLSCLNEKLTKRNICSQLPLYTRLFHPRLADRIARDAKRLFAILVLIEKPHAMHSMIQDGLTDEHLSLSLEEDIKPKSVLISKKDGKDSKEFKCFASQVQARDFYERQWMVQAPFFNIPGGHFEMDTHCALPLTQCYEAASGPFAVVYKGAVHPAHHQGFGADGSALPVAVKEFKTEELFKKEKENLQQIQSLTHKHLIKIIATYQMLGISEALLALHLENCRYGDLKPENVLHFKEGAEDPGILVIADVGVSKFYQQVINIRNEPTDTRATTPIYEAPEVQPDVKDPRSRRYDMWSMGCMFLEHIVWLLYAHDAMLRFRNSRKSVEPEIRDGSFYRRVQRPGKSRDESPDQSSDQLPDPKDLLHPTVLKAFEKLREDPNCQPGTALGDLVKLISEDLMVGVHQRVGATELVDRLRRIVADSKHPGYLRIEFDDRVSKQRFLDIFSACQAGVEQ